ncbi:phosphatase [Kocuria flava]|uniref:phosphatase n=1 Tax=Kocuria flava TaxID=446860 RepID=UPI002F920299
MRSFPAPAPTADDLLRHLDEHRLTGPVATPREANLRNIQGFLDGDQHQHMGVVRTREWSFDDVFALMCERVGISADRGHLEGQDTISAALAVAALERYAAALGEVVAAGGRVLLATGHPAGLFPVYARIAGAARRAGAHVVQVRDGFAFEDGDVRQIQDVVMVEQYGGLRHTHFPGPMELALDRLERDGQAPPDLVVADHGLAGAAGSRGLRTIAIADCNDPGVFVAEAQGQVEVAVPLDDNLPPRRYDPVTAFVLERAGLAAHA